MFMGDTLPPFTHPRTTNSKSTLSPMLRLLLLLLLLLLLPFPLSRYPVGKLTERLPLGSLLNPCPFNGKEHCIIMTIALVSEDRARDTTIRY